LKFPRVFLQQNLLSASTSKEVQDDIFKGEFLDLFTQTEVLPYRPPQPRPYEHSAMAKEIGWRLTQFGRTMEA